MAENLDVYRLLAEREFHERMCDSGGSRYTVVGGIGLRATTEGVPDWDNRRITISDSVHMSAVRPNGTRRDIDTLIHTTDGDEVELYARLMDGVVGGALVVSAFGIGSYARNRRGWFDFVGRRYVDDFGKLFWRASGIETEIPRESLEPWTIMENGELVCQILNPVSQLGAYSVRSITGVRVKDREKYKNLHRAVMPNDRISDIPADYREQYFAFLEQARKVEAARKKIGWLGAKAALLSFLERQEWAERLAQGSLDGALSVFTGKK